jgi:hypothetical protein
MSQQFPLGTNYEAIRSAIETAVRDTLDPPPYLPSNSYSQWDRVSVNGIVFAAKVDSPSYLSGAAEDWENEGPTVAVRYENVGDTLPSAGGVRIHIVWGETSDKTIPFRCRDQGRTYKTRKSNGTLQFWIYTPKNQGTSPGLLIAQRLRELAYTWDYGSMTKNGSDFRVMDLNGPRKITEQQGSPHFLQVLTATLCVHETV